VFSENLILGNIPGCFNNFISIFAVIYVVLFFFKYYEQSLQNLFNTQYCESASPVFALENKKINR